MRWDGVVWCGVVYDHRYLICCRYIYIHAYNASKQYSSTLSRSDSLHDDEQTSWMM